VLRQAVPAWRIRGVFWKKHHPWFRRVLLVANAGLPLVVFVCWGFQAWTAFGFTLGAAVLAHAALLLGIFHPRCPWLGPVTRVFRMEGQNVWLTLDDGPDDEHSIRLAKALKFRGVRATFFVIGERLRRESDAARALVAAGHMLANHSDTHPRSAMWRAGPGMAARELNGAGEALRVQGGEARWFRAPVGHKSPCLHPVLKKHGSRLISWTVGGRDGWRPDPKPVVRRVLAAARPGAIIMLHEGRPHSVETILAVVDALLARGFQFVIPTDAELE
jgi:peptidoglycan/xylan/chitin deacetylase (PgdA/CDA1 family)